MDTIPAEQYFLNRAGTVGPERHISQLKYLTSSTYQSIHIQIVDPAIPADL